MGCSLVSQWTKTGKAVEHLANVYSGTGTNLSNNLQRHNEDAKEWHGLFVKFWKEMTGAILFAAWGAVKLYQRDPHKPKRRIQDETV